MPNEPLARYNKRRIVFYKEHPTCPTAWWGAYQAMKSVAELEKIKVDEWKAAKARKRRASKVQADK
jgi:hypothetical protein